MPKDYRAGGTTDRLVSFVDLAPTVLSPGRTGAATVASGATRSWARAPPRRNRSCMDFAAGWTSATIWCARFATSDTCMYATTCRIGFTDSILAYMFETPTTRVWKKLNDKGKLNEVQGAFWNTKPAEELYDLATDRDEVRNLAVVAADIAPLWSDMRKAQRDLAAKICDVGFPARRRDSFARGVCGAV